MAEHRYVHGYSRTESERLSDQAATLAELLHSGTRYAAGSRVLEAGCGIGAQTVILAANSPKARITSIDISPASLAKARAALKRKHITNVTLRQADIFHLPFADRSFDHLFICFVLEHLSRPLDALSELRRVLKTGGTITVIEGDHGSAFFHPDDPAARKTIQCLIDLQAAAGGNSVIGRELFPLLKGTGFRDIHVAPRMVYADASRPGLADGFTRKTFTAMVKGVRAQALAAGMMKERDWKKGIAALYRTARKDGTFCYTFFKGRGVK